MYTHWQLYQHTPTPPYELQHLLRPCERWVPPHLEVAHLPHAIGQPYGGLYLFTQSARMARPVRYWAGGGGLELLGTLEQSTLDIHCPDGGAGGTPGLRFSHGELSAGVKASLSPTLTPKVSSTRTGLLPPLTPLPPLPNASPQAPCCLLLPASRHTLITISHLVTCISARWASKRWARRLRHWRTALTPSCTACRRHRRQLHAQPGMWAGRS